MVKRIKRKYDRGVALLATIVAIALMTLLVVDFTNSAALGYRSAANQADSLRARYLGRSGVAVGLAMLAQDARMTRAPPATTIPTMRSIRPGRSRCRRFRSTAGRSRSRWWTKREDLR